MHFKPIKAILDHVYFTCQARGSTPKKTILVLTMEKGTKKGHIFGVRPLIFCPRILTEIACSQPWRRHGRHSGCGAPVSAEPSITSNLVKSCHHGRPPPTQQGQAGKQQRVQQSSFSRYLSLIVGLNVKCSYQGYRKLLSIIVHEKIVKMTTRAFQYTIQLRPPLALMVRWSETLVSQLYYPRQN